MPASDPSVVVLAGRRRRKVLHPASKGAPRNLWTMRWGLLSQTELTAGDRRRFHAHCTKGPLTLLCRRNREPRRFARFKRGHHHQRDGHLRRTVLLAVVGNTVGIGHHGVALRVGVVAERFAMSSRLPSQFRSIQPLGTYRWQPATHDRSATVTDKAPARCLVCNSCLGRVRREREGSRSPS